MPLEKISRHFGEALVSLVPPLWGKPVVAALLRSYVNRIQELEDDVFEVLRAFDVRVADEARLKVLAKVVGQPNFGWGLETYRAIVMARIATNRSHGREDDIVNVLRLITQSDAPINITAFAPAAMLVEIGEHVDGDHMIAVAFLLPKARAAGVQQHFLNPPPVSEDSGHLTFASAVSGGGGETASAVSGGGDGIYSSRRF